MIERRQTAHLAPEALHPFLVLDEALWQHLDRHLAAQSRVARAVHLTHGPAAEGAEDLVLDRLEHEFRRLDRHPDDLLQLLKSARERGLVVELGKRMSSDSEVAGVAVDADRRLAGAGDLPGVRRIDARADELRR